jgi:hypothetical protein
MPFGNFAAGTGGNIPVPNSVALDPPVAATITLNALASGAARQSVYIANPNGRQAAKVTLEITMGAIAPILGTIVELWLLRSKAQVLAGLVGDDGTTSVDAAYPVPPTLPRNATLIGALSVTATAAGVFRGTFDTNDVGLLGDFFGFAVSNRTDQPLGVSATNTVTYETY